MQAHAGRAVQEQGDQVGLCHPTKPLRPAQSVKCISHCSGPGEISVEVRVDDGGGEVRIPRVEVVALDDVHRGDGDGRSGEVASQRAGGCAGRRVEAAAAAEAV